MSEKEREYEDFYGNDQYLDQELMLQEQMALMEDPAMDADFGLEPVGDMPTQEDDWSEPQPSRADLFAQELFVDEFDEDDDSLPAVLEEPMDLDEVPEADEPVPVDAPAGEKKEEDAGTFWGCVILVVIAVAIIALIWWLIASGILGAIFSFLIKAAIVIGLIGWVISWFTD